MLGYLIGSAQDEPGDGAFRFDFGRQTVTDVVVLTPLLVLHLLEDSDHILADQTLMLWRAKNRTVSRVTALDNQEAQTSDVLLEHADIEMLQLRGDRNGVQAADGAGAVSHIGPPPIFASKAVFYLSL